MKKAKPAQKVPGRISPTEALHILIRGGLSPDRAAVRLTNALHSNDPCRLWGNGKLIEFQAMTLMVVPIRGDDGRWTGTADIASAAREPWDKPSYRWEFDADEVRALLPPSERPSDPLAPSPRRPGPPPNTERWFAICAEIARRCIDEKTGRVAVPKSENKLADAMLDYLAEIGQGRPSTSEMRMAVKYICAALRKVQR